MRMELSKDGVPASRELVERGTHHKLLPSSCHPALFTDQFHIALDADTAGAAKLCPILSLEGTPEVAPEDAGEKVTHRLRRQFSPSKSIARVMPIFVSLTNSWMRIP